MSAVENSPSMSSVRMKECIRTARAVSNFRDKKSRENLSSGPRESRGNRIETPIPEAKIIIQKFVTEIMKAGEEEKSKR